MAQRAIVIALDTNLLVYAHRSGAPEHRQAIAALERAANDAGGWGISQPVVAEFWSIVTHPKASGGPSPFKRAAAFIQELIDASEMRVWMPAAAFAGKLVEQAARLSVSGVRIFDLQIGLIAAENGAREMWTHDRNFVRVPGIKIYDPL